jgi:hypothetical protein
MVEDPMDYLIAALFGLSIGTLMAYSRSPTTRWPSSVAVTVVLVVGIGYATLGPDGSSALGTVVALASLVAATLADGAAWAGHPLLAGTGYWYRVWAALWHTSMLRRSFAEAPEPDSSQQESPRP